MLSIINAAEIQFRHESEIRMREHALMASIRERRAAESTHDMGSVAPLTATSARSSQATTRTAHAAWPRPIGVATCPAPARAVA